MVACRLDGITRHRPVMATRDDDSERVPVVVASGQSLERDELVTPLDLMARAAEAALAEAPALRGAIERVSVVNVLGHVGRSPASDLAARLGIAAPACEVSTVGGNTPQWLVNRAASAIAAGDLSATLIVGAEALRSSRVRRAAGAQQRAPESDRPADPVVGDDRPGLGPAEFGIGLMLPVHIYPMLESVIAARAGHDARAHRQAMGALLAPFTEVAAHHPFAWFPERHSPEDIATPSADNRVVAEPYTKRMAAFLGSDQGAALIVCSLGAARRAGVADRAVFVWAGAEATDVFSPTARPDPGRSPAIAAAGRALFLAANQAAGTNGRLDIDDVDLVDLYSCFPSAVEAAVESLGIDPEHRCLTVTGGLPYFGGPGNNYTTHAIATLTDRLRQEEGHGGGPLPRLGLATGLGWFVTKHAVGLYGSEPPPAGFRRGVTDLDQQAIDASAVEVALEVDEVTRATVVAATVVREGDGDAQDGMGEPAGAPVIARLPDGRHLACIPADADVLSAMGDRDVPGLVGSRALRPTRTAALPSALSAGPAELAVPHRNPGSPHVRRSDPRAPWPGRDPDHQPARGAQRHQRRRVQGDVGGPRRAGRRRQLPSRDRDRRRGQGVQRRHGPQGLRRRRGGRHHGCRGRLRRAHPARPSTSRSSPPSTAMPWPAVARSCSRATSSLPSTTPPSASPRSSAG